MTRPIRKAIFPVGGLGTRFLPATKALPKEMLPVVDKPLIQYAVEEARASGIEEFVFVTGRGKSAIEDHFDHSTELRDALIARGKKAELDSVEDMLLEPGQVAYIRQQEPLGLGHAVWCARNIARGEPVAVLLADDLVLAEVLEHEVQFVAHLVADRARDADAARRRQRFDTRRHVDSVAQQIATLGDHITNVDADAKENLLLSIHAVVAARHALLKSDGASHRVDGAPELQQQAVAGRVGDAATVRFYQRVDELRPMRAQGAERTFLVVTDQTGVTRHIGGDDRCQPAVLTLQKGTLPWDAL